MSKKLFIFIISICICLFIVSAIIRFVLPKNSNTKIITTSTLKDAIDIAQLSSAEFNYIGIADVYTDEQKKNIKCRICYHASVKASINGEIHFDINEDEKTISVLLPDIHLDSYILNDIPMSTIPASANIDLPEMLKCCEEDAKKEAEASPIFKGEAKKSLKDTVEKLLKPLLEPQGYRLLPIPE